RWRTHGDLDRSRSPGVAGGCWGFDPPLPETGPDPCGEQRSVGFERVSTHVHVVLPLLPHLTTVSLDVSAVDQAQRQPGAHPYGVAREPEQLVIHLPIDDRVPPLVERHHFRQQLGAQTAGLARRPVDTERAAHDATLPSRRTTCGRAHAQWPAPCRSTSSAYDANSAGGSRTVPSGCAQAPRPSTRVARSLTLRVP